MDFSLGKNQKLKSKKTISLLFVEGESLKSYPLKMIYLPCEDKVNKVAFSVPKRNFKLAVDRNRIKRLLREAYRLNKHHYFQESKTFQIMFVYMGRKKPTFLEVEISLQKLLSKFNNHLIKLAN